MLARPNIQRRSRNFIYQRNGKPESRQVHTFNVMLAGITGFDAQVVELGCVKVPEFCWPLFTTISAGDAPERPVDRAGCTYKVSVATLRCRFSDLKKTHLRHTAAEWTAPFRRFKRSIKGVPARLCQPTRIRLQERFRKKLRVGGTAPILQKHLVDCSARCGHKTARLVCKWGRPIRLHCAQHGG